MTLDEVRAEGEAIRRWWTTHLPDGKGGFHGEVDAENRPATDVPRGIILYARLLWYFSAVGEKALAEQAFVYIIRYFVNVDNLAWMVDVDGRIIDPKLQGYAQAFGIYALAEYHCLTGDVAALDMARRLRDLLETRFRDATRGGYIEAIGGDQRLSDKDLDAPKTMNTHLHVLEAYTRLHQVAPDADTEAALRHVLAVFLERFAVGDHLRVFFDMDWTDRTQSVSFGHDIEASWLVWEAAGTLGDTALIGRARPVVLALARATRDEGFNALGGISYERGFDGRLDPDGEWWGQAEGLVGFINAWQMTEDKAYFDAARRLWDHIRAQYVRNGEWTWYAAATGRPMYRAGVWKCPYHNGRAMLELEKRLAGLDRCSFLV